MSAPPSGRHGHRLSLQNAIKQMQSQRVLPSQWNDETPQVALTLCPVGRPSHTTTFRNWTCTGWWHDPESRCVSWVVDTEVPAQLIIHWPDTKRIQLYVHRRRNQYVVPLPDSSRALYITLDTSGRGKVSTIAIEEN